MSRSVLVQHANQSNEVVDSKHDVVLTFNNVVDVQTTLLQRKNDVVCLLGTNKHQKVEIHGFFIYKAIET